MGGSQPAGGQLGCFAVALLVPFASFWRAREGPYPCEVSRARCLGRLLPVGSAVLRVLPPA